MGCGPSPAALAKKNGGLSRRFNRMRLWAAAFTLQPRRASRHCPAAESVAPRRHIR